VHGRGWLYTSYQNVGVDRRSSGITDEVLTPEGFVW
jgi:hypothetical protein